MEKYSTHWWTFSKWIPYFEFKEGLEDFSKCPNCDENTFFKWKCNSCWYWKWDDFIKKIREKIEQKINL